MKKRKRSRGLGSSPDTHARRANALLLEADEALQRAMKATTCNARAGNALEAYGAAMAASEHAEASGRYGRLGNTIALKAAAALTTCVKEDSHAPPKYTKHKFQLLPGGRR